MSTFKNIALLGATGNLGSRILKALINEGFAVTAVQRASSTNVAAKAAKSIKVDLSSQDALTDAFKGHDIVVSAMPFPKLETDKIWMQAAIAAGVKRIVPSEFSTNLENELSQKLPIVADKVEIRKYLTKLADEGKIEWTSINNGPFFIRNIWSTGWLGPNVEKKTANYHDDGYAIVCTSTLERIGEGVAKALSPKHAAETKNKSIYVYSATMSERKAVDLVSKVTGIPVKDFKESHTSIDKITREAYEATEKGDMSKMFDFYIPFCFGEGYGGDFRDIAWNEKLGLKSMSDDQIMEKLKAWLK